MSDCDCVEFCSRWAKCEDQYGPWEYWLPLYPWFGSSNCKLYTGKDKTMKQTIINRDI